MLDVIILAANPNKQPCAGAGCSMEPALFAVDVRPVRLKAKK